MISEADILKAALSVLREIEETHQPFNLDTISNTEAIHLLLSRLGLKT